MEYLFQLGTDNISNSLRTSCGGICYKELQHGAREEWQETVGRLKPGTQCGYSPQDNALSYQETANTKKETPAP